MKMSKSILPSIGVVKPENPAEYFLTPFQDGNKIFCSFLEQAEKKIRIMIYGFTLQDAYDVLIAKKKAGLDVKLVLDHTQAMGHYEKPQIKRLVKAGFVDGKDFVVGTSPKHHEINHLKASWIDDNQVLSGSWNYSVSATQEYNDIQIVESPKLAQTFEKVFDFAFEWVLKNENQYQVFTG